jgi:hypothetical protein
LLFPCCRSVQEGNGHPRANIQKEKRRRIKIVEGDCPPRFNNQDKVSIITERERGGRKGREREKERRGGGRSCTAWISFFTLCTSGSYNRNACSMKVLVFATRDPTGKASKPPDPGQKHRTPKTKGERPKAEKINTT